MLPLTDVLATADMRAADIAIHEWAATAEPSPHELVALVRMAPRLRARLTAITVIQGPNGPITWREFEHVLWTLGEGFRQVLKRHPRLRRDPALFRAVATLCLDTANGKGRESFTMLLGQYGGQDQISTVLALLDDPELDGHALLALRTLKAPGGLQTALRLLKHSSTWKRSEARKYLRRHYPGEVAT